MKSLAFDTISKSFSIALVCDENIHELNRERLEKSSNVYLICELDNLLKSNNIDINEIDFISMGIGPGSFTALRIAFATIKSLAYASAKPIIGVSSLDALYKNIEHYNTIKCAFIDARKGSVYAKIYNKDSVILDTLDITYDDAFAFIKKYMSDNDIDSTQEIVFCGDGYLSAKEIIDENFNVVKVDDDSHIIKAKNIHLLASSRYKQGDFDDIFKLNPLYIRKAEAEILHDKLSQNK